MKKLIPILLILCLGAPSLLRAAEPAPEPQPEAAGAPTVFPHPDTRPWLVAGQLNIIFQSHPPFHSPYEGTNSMLGRGEYKTSLLGTLYLGVQAHKNLRYNTDLLYDEESSGGRGLSEALGLAGFTNLDVVRNPTLGVTPYMARVEVHQTIGLTDEMVDADGGRTPFALATRVPVRRIELRAGKMSLPDQLDLNSVASDSHLQFENWTVDNNGAWDYAADTRGYTWAGIVEYDDRVWSARYAIATMPTVANGIDLDYALRRASGQTWEFELRRSLLTGRKGVWRAMTYVNHAHMGNYRQAVQQFTSGAVKQPDITLSERNGAMKYGLGANAEQELTANLRVAARFGWNDNSTESYAYSEVGQTFEMAADYAFTRWHRPNDKVGAALVSNAIKRDNQNYLRDGGLGFLLGDGKLNYAREDILEMYYNRHVWSGFYAALGTQLIAHPGYNKDRGPVAVFTVRTHVDF